MSVNAPVKELNTFEAAQKYNQKGIFATKNGHFFYTKKDQKGKIAFSLKPVLLQLLA